MIVPRNEVEDDKSKKNIRIVGQVTDNKKLPLPGVTVIVKGLTIGTATDWERAIHFNPSQGGKVVLAFLLCRDENPGGGIYRKRHD